MSGNKYIEKEDYYVGICPDGTEFLIDAIDYESVSQKTWVKRKASIATKDGKWGIGLGAFIVSPEEKSKKVFRKDCSSYDFRRKNLYCGNIYVKRDGYYECEDFAGNKFFIDECDYNDCSKYVWHVDPNGYVISKFADGKVRKLHRFLLGLKNGDKLEVDHIDRNPLNNRRENLRLADRSMNCQNRGMSSKNKSGVTGVCKSGSGWVAQINDKGVRHYLGYFLDKEEAIRKRKEAELQIPTFQTNRQSAAKTRIG